MSLLACCDWRKADLSVIPDGGVMHMITDPPYSDHVHSCSRRGLTAWAGEISESREMGFDPITTDEMEALADLAARIVRRWSLVFCDMESIHLWRGAFQSAGLEALRVMFWDKSNGAPQFTGDRPAVPGEAIVVAHPKGKKRWNGGGKRGFYSFPSAIDRLHNGAEKRIHPAQKPLALMRALIEDFTDPGDNILDPYCGSGTTIVACESLGRSGIGFERDPRFYEVACARVAGDETKPPPGQLAMFGGHSR